MASLDYKNQKIGIVGLGKTGISSYNFLQGKAVKIICYDDLKKNCDIFAQAYGDGIITDPSSIAWQDLDKIIFSPGILPTHQIRTIAKKYNIEVISDIDILYQENKNAKFIAITGTNGKSTTTALIYHILKSVGLDYAIGGNIGIPVLDLPMGKKGYILELSSYQLDLIKNLKSSAIALLNITPDHFDRYGSMANYINSKKQIFKYLKNDGCAVLNIDDQNISQVSNHLQTYQVINISSITKQSRGVSVINGMLNDNISKHQQIRLPSNKFLLGQHNAENIAVAYSICRYLEVNSADIISAIESFIGLAHRMQYVGKTSNISFYNDSKATNAIAASKSLAALNNIHWLVGGITKEDNLNPIEPFFKNINKAYIFGRDKSLIQKILHGKIAYYVCDDIYEAFERAYQDASINKDFEQNIVLAPACASLDQFTNFEQRGEVFMQLCNQKLRNEAINYS